MADKQYNDHIHVWQAWIEACEWHDYDRQVTNSTWLRGVVTSAVPILTQYVPRGNVLRVQINATHFTARVVVNERGIIIDAAPILHYMTGWPMMDVLLYCIQRKWIASRVEEAT